MIKKILMSALSLFPAYLVYCAIRGFVYGVKCGVREEALDMEHCAKIASFKA